MSREVAAIRQGNANARSVVYDVAVCQDETIRREDKSRAAAVPLTRFSITPGRGLRDFDLGNRRADFFGCGDNGTRVSIKQGRVTMCRCELNDRRVVDFGTCDKLFQHDW